MELLPSLRYKIKKAFWFIPVTYSIMAVVFACLMFWIDENTYIVPEEGWMTYLLLTSPDLGTAILSSLSASILTMMTVMFSSMLVVLTFYSSDYSPRTIQNFVQDRRSKHVLGVFVSSFIYIVFVLMLIQNTDSTLLFIPISAIVVTIVCIGYFVYFIHYVSKTIQVKQLLDEISEETRQAINKTYGTHSEYSLKNEAPWKSWEVEDLTVESAHPVKARSYGYLQLLNIPALVERATQDNITLKVECYIGDFVFEETHLFSYWKHKDQEVHINDYFQYMTIGPERTTMQDVHFSIQKLLDITLRTLSAGINDPKTAISCVYELGKVLALIAEKGIPTPYYYDNQDNLRLVIKQHHFDDLMYHCFAQISHYGQDDLFILTAVLDTLALIAEKNDQEIKDKIWAFHQYILHKFNTDHLHEWDEQHLQNYIDRLARKTGHTNTKQTEKQQKNGTN